MDRASAGQKWSGVHVGFLAGVNRYAMATAIAINGRVHNEKAASRLRDVRGKLIRFR